jgi:hypothetical protein
MRCSLCKLIICFLLIYAESLDITFWHPLHCYVRNGHLRYDTQHKVLMAYTTSFPTTSVYRNDVVIPVYIFLEVVLGRHTTCHGHHYSDVHIQSCCPFHATCNTHVSWVVEEERN